MARKKRQVDDEGVRDNLTQQDEADVVEAVGAEPDADTGELVADEERVMALGAVDAESVRENQRVRDYVGKKRGNVRNVPFNIGDVLTKYDTLLKLLPANSIDITVKRQTGTPIQHTITSRPKSGMELYEAIRQLHGPHEEAQYEVRFVDNGTKEFRGIGRITMPDARGSAPHPQQGQQPMNSYNPFAPGYPPPPGYAYPPPGTPPGYYPAPQQSQPPPQAPAQPAAQPQPMQPPPQVFVQPPAAPGFEELLASMRTMFEMFQTMRQQAQPAPAPAPQQPMIAPPPPPSGTPDMASMMAWMQQMGEFVRTMQPTPSAPQPTPAPAPTTPNPMAMMGMMPPITPPPGTMWIPGFGFAPLDRVAQLFGAAPAGPGMGARMGPGPSYGPRQYQGPGEPAQQRVEPQRPPPSPTDQFREALSLMKTVTRMAQEFTDIGGGAPEAPEVPTPQEDDSPVRIIDTGQAKVLVNKSDGSLRGWETMWANMDKIFKWAGEQGDAWRKAQTERGQPQQAPRQLAPGYVEVGPGYQPPPGWAAVPVDPASVPPPAQQKLPPPPAQVPPPIQERRTWGVPTIPDQGE